MEFDSFVLAASTTDLTQARQAREHADAIEYRVDRSSAGLAPVAAHDGHGLPVIVTNRVTREGGAADPGDARLSTLAAAAAHPAVAAVDVELAAVRAGNADGVLAAARDHDTAVIVSTHNFAKTPPPARLRTLLAAAADHGDVAKLATHADSPTDVLDLLAATHAATAAGHRVATVAMGDVGRHSRVIAPVYGSRIGYAPVDTADTTAPGQYDLATLRRLIADIATGATATQQQD